MSSVVWCTVETLHQPTSMSSTYTNVQERQHTCTPPQATIRRLTEVDEKMSKLFKPEEDIRGIETFEIEGMVFKHCECAH